MIEDDIYRASSQYRYWSYTKESLARIREETNKLASQRVKAAFRRVHAANRSSQNGDHENGGTGNGDGPDAAHVEIETLTVHEELKIVEWHCSKIMDMGEAMNPRIPSHVVATAIQYLRRFYLTNSPMTYHPKQIMMCALYLATKADHFYIPLSRFIAEFDNVSEDDVKAPEFLLLQGLRFTLDVRHPMKGLQGGHVEMNVLAEEGRLGSSITKANGSEKRVGIAADRAKKLLATAAQMTDAYFLYTPSQIWLAAVMVADRELVEAYVSAKLGALPLAANDAEAAAANFKQKLMATLSSCAALLESYRSAEDDAAQRKEMRRIGKKLTVCQNPEKMDIVAVARAKAAEKREGGDGSDAEKALKKRKLERERLERDGDVFGPELRDVKT
ncbi:uncharacterized protein Z519_09925 [Cladophialophora bantiana CBS 173.52]|uniref:RNA polymerase II holoenzyme cyclin-like subunit n=1 Tax=Cladophialophora bantiana (strain ATCC 10958 / CBS 173.52 / CDC B-1940 / NIH 8579) TaxID=1442370 RepID=A0A0D2H911_CLAB1|nr:uncharacterized protein Z519_09925 [Cladophialophora bantiana CBS 173.52]KIW89768.1 hypothetical protein Z519_09925 [Cladophialophora bantiana CBS 173.52]